MKAMLIAAMVAALGVSARVEACTGDCNDDGLVTVDEIILGVNIALGSAELTQCQRFDGDGRDGRRDRRRGQQRSERL